MGQIVPAKFQAFDSTGAPLSGGKLHTYEAGTSTNKTTYSDSALTTPNANPVVLDSRGEAAVFGTGSYKFVLKTSADVTLWTVDDVEVVGVAYLQDADEDTKLQVEETVDEDKIRFDIAGTEQCLLQDGAWLPTTDNDVNLGSATKKFKDLFITRVDIEGTYFALMPTNGVAANAVFMLGNASTIAWFYLNAAPPGWKVLATGADSVLAVSGGSDAYNANGGTQGGTWTWPDYTLLEADIPAHTHGETGDHTHDESQLQSVAGGTSSNPVSANGAAGGTMTTTSDGAHTHTSVGSDGAHSHGGTTFRPAASIGKLYQLDTA